MKLRHLTSSLIELRQLMKLTHLASSTSFTHEAQTSRVLHSRSSDFSRPSLRKITHLVSFLQGAQTYHVLHSSIVLRHFLFYTHGVQIQPVITNRGFISTSCLLIVLRAHTYELIASRLHSVMVHWEHFLKDIFWKASGIISCRREHIRIHIICSFAVQMDLDALTWSTRR